MTRYRCTRCKYVYDPQRGDPQGGIAQGTPFSALPEGWHCPVSGAPKEEFFPLDELLQAAEKDGDRARLKRVQPAVSQHQPAEPAEPGTSAAAVAAAGPSPSPSPSPDRVWTVGSLKRRAG